MFSLKTLFKTECFYLYIDLTTTLIYTIYMEKYKIDLHSKDFFSLQKADGFLDFYDLLKNKENFKLGFYNFCFETTDGVNLYLKPARPNSYTHYGDVIGSHFARYFNLPVTQYFLAKIGSVEGSISFDYKKQNEKEVSGLKFIKEYKKSCYKARKKDIYNDVPSIIEALNFFSQDNQKNHKYYLTKEQAKTISSQLISLFMLNTIILNKDCHNENWGLLFESGKGARLIPVFDFGYSFYLEQDRRLLYSWLEKEIKLPSRSNIKKTDNFFKELNEKRLMSFTMLSIANPVSLFQSDLEVNACKKLFPNEFKKNMQIINSIRINSIFKDIEDETGAKIPSLVKNVVLKAYEQKHIT